MRATYQEKQAFDNYFELKQGEPLVDSEPTGDQITHTVRSANAEGAEAQIVVLATRRLVQGR